MSKIKPRVIETDEGIQGEFTVTAYDKMQRQLRNKGWIGTKSIITSGINYGLVLEIGPGPGYLGLEWLKKTSNTSLKCVEISSDMIQIANRNALEYRLVDRIEYKQGRAEKIPFGESTFDAVFSNGSLHEWTDPIQVLSEIRRVLKTGARFLVSDLKRNMHPFMVWFLKINTQPKAMRSGLLSSINAAYTREEIIDIISKTQFTNTTVTENMMGIDIKGTK
jgi:ubiquinone/menaquinone biosynthesis C-methylase UbiE